MCSPSSRSEFRLGLLDDPRLPRAASPVSTGKRERAPSPAAAFVTVTVRQQRRRVQRGEDRRPRARRQRRGLDQDEGRRQERGGHHVPGYGRGEEALRDGRLLSQLQRCSAFIITS